MSSNGKFILSIADLYPYECAAVQYRYAKAAPLCEEIKAGKKKLEDLTPAQVCKVDGKWLVKDGCNRVYAAKQAGLKTIYVVEYGYGLGPTDDQAHKDTIMLRDKKMQKGFENYTIVAGDTERNKLTDDEMNEIRQMKLDGGLDDLL